MTHTPGPWHVGDDGDHFWVFPQPPTANVICDIVGRIYDSTAHATQITDEDFDNARLIAAAPALLAACQAAFEWLAAFGQDAPITFGGEQELHDKLHTAIAQAHGEETP